MTDRQLADLRMYRTVVGYSDSTPLISGTRPGFILGINSLRTIVMAIGVTSGMQGINTTGSTKDRRNSYGSLCSEIFEVEAGAKGYAGNARNYTLFNSFKSNEDEVNHIGFDNIGSYTDNLIEVITPLIPVLETDWGVDAPKVLLLSNALSGYRVEELLPRNAIVGRKTQTDLLPGLYTNARQVIKEVIMPAAVTLRSTQKTWYTGLLNAEKIVNYPTGTTVYEGYLLDIHGNPIYNGNIDFALQNIHIKSQFDGSYHAAPFPHGIASPIASAVGFNPQAAPNEEVKQGSTVHHNFTLSAAV